MTPDRSKRIDEVLDCRQPDLTVVFENVHDPHNIAAVMRTADSIGIQELFVLNTNNRPTVKFGKKSSASASRWLTVHHFDQVEACFSVLRKRYNRILATHLDAQACSLYEVDFTQRLALVFGNEHQGISSEVLQQCDGNFIIPQVGMVRSLNISVACAVTLYEAFRQRHQQGFYRECRLSPTARLQLLDTWTMDK